jgi:prepilin-type N-terminal cleavage/methylation domain-containing protein
MRRLRARLDQAGVTLVELMVVVAVIGILVFALGFSYQGWIGRYKVESAMKEMHADMMNARVRAMQRGRTHFLSVSGQRYAIHEDTSPAPDGNGVLETGADTEVVDKDTQRDLTVQGFASPLALRRDGLAASEGSVRIPWRDWDDELNPDYDCIDIAQTRLNLGLWDEAISNCISK